MSVVIGIVVVGGLMWLLYAGRVKVIASRRYNWNRRQAPEIDRFSEPKRTTAEAGAPPPNGRDASGH